VLAHLASIASEAINEGRYETMGHAMVTVEQVNGLFAANRSEQARETAYVA
jgi:hypothetical protein